MIKEGVVVTGICMHGKRGILPTVLITEDPVPVHIMRKSGIIPSVLITEDPAPVHIMRKKYRRNRYHVFN